MTDKISRDNQVRQTRSWQVPLEDQRLYEMNYIDNFYSKKKKKRCDCNINYLLS